MSADERYSLYIWAGVAFNHIAQRGYLQRVGWGCALTDDDARGLALGYLLTALPISGGWLNHQVIVHRAAPLPVGLVANLDAPELANWPGPVFRPVRSDDGPEPRSGSLPEIALSVSLTDDWFSILPKPGGDDGTK